MSVDLRDEIHPDIARRLAAIESAVADAKNDAEQAKALAGDAFHFADDIRRLVKPTSPTHTRKVRDAAGWLSLAGLSVGSAAVYLPLGLITPSAIVLGILVLSVILRERRQTESKESTRRSV